jgi:PleD family two-component response regulator
MNRQADRPTILIADDDSTIRRNLVMLLQSEKFDVREAADGLEAAEALATGSISAATAWTSFGRTLITWKRRR